MATDFFGSPFVLPGSSDLPVEQSNGRIKLKFAEGSQCGDGFAFTRRKVVDSCDEMAEESTSATFAPDYFVESSVCGEEIDISLDYQDYVKDLEVGAIYCYHVHAFAKEYMVDLKKSDGSSVRRSEAPLKLRHRVAWVRWPLAGPIRFGISQHESGVICEDSNEDVSTSWRATSRGNDRDMEAAEDKPVGR